ncbi:cilia- and flagella-associated protein 97-like [Palaemon carinicauda]|uniref:cilia- and flagella-associated protein 97-like n=1 Tax=Palaemon carinicauda TaxID=392227 RepID=UPI0035B649BA
MAAGCIQEGRWKAKAGRWQARETYNTRVRDRMAHKIGLHDTQYEPDICGAVDLSLVVEDDSEVERTKGALAISETVSEKHSVIVLAEPTPPSSSSPPHDQLRHYKDCSSSVLAADASSASLVLSSRFVEDISCGLTKEEEQKKRGGAVVGDGSAGRSRTTRKTSRTSRLLSAEGQQRDSGHEGAGEAMRHGHRSSFGSRTSERGPAGSASSFEASANATAMEGRVDQNLIPSLYSSDEWDEESDLSSASDGEQDHSDSSDDDDPKSQVDRLIERGTLMYMDGENSNLSSETESSDDDSSDYDDSDSESDITDVSPLLSATASPLGLSPVLPRRTLGTSPLALHDNRDLVVVDFSRPEISSNDQGYDSQPHCNGSSHSNSDDSTDMTLLLKAVVELEKKQRQKRSHHHQTTRSSALSNDHYNNRHHSSRSRQSTGRHYNNHHHHHHHQNVQNNIHHNQQIEPSSPISIHPIDASPHHSHLRRASHSHRRKNMSFSNDEVRRIDRDNQILLKKIMSAHTRSSRNQSSSTSSSSNQNSRTVHVHRPANSTVNRKREEEKIRRENMILLRKIQEAKPSKDVTASRSPRHRTAHGVRPPSSLPATPGSIGASARTA